MDKNYLPTKKETEHIEMNALNISKSGESYSVEHDSLVGAAEPTNISFLRQRKTYGNGKLSNPLAGLSPEALEKRGEQYAAICGRPDLAETFKKGALLAQDPAAFRGPLQDSFSDEDLRSLLYEEEHKWRAQCGKLYFMSLVCSVAAAVQGMDQSVINGANIFFPKSLGIGSGSLRDEWLDGLIIGAPYFTACLISCWLTAPLNAWFGRRGTVFISCLICCLASISQFFCQHWYQLLAVRFVLGVGIGPKSGTVPTFSAECAPKQIRGSLVMMWQTWTAFGIMLGYVMDLAFFKIEGTAAYPDLQWRLMLGSACIPPIFVMIMVYFVPESPGWYMKAGAHDRAFRSMQRLRKTDLAAARDLYLAYSLQETEKAVIRGNFLERCGQLFTVPRNRRAMTASQILMFMQQFCGVNVIAYYSSVIFEEAGFSQSVALLCSLGFGAINFVFSWPAVFTIDKFGRRPLLLTTFPLMAGLLFFVGASFNLTALTTRLGCIATGLYVFGAVYAPGEGPVPFTYAAEAYPLYIRDVGMSFSTATNWFFNGMLGLTWPAMQRAMKPQGAFSFYGAFNIIGWILVLLLVPETKGLSLEELDNVFEVGTRDQMIYGLKNMVHFWKTHIFRIAGEAPKNPANVELDSGSELEAEIVVPTPKPGQV